MKKKRPPTPAPAPAPSVVAAPADDAEWEAATDVVAEACRAFVHVLPPAQLEAYAAELRAYLLADPEGRALLRRTLEDPEVTASDDVPRDAPPIPTREKASSAVPVASTKHPKKAAG